MKTLTTILTVAAAAVSLSAAPARAEPVTLTWQMWAGTDAEIAAWKHAAELVNAQNPDIRIELQTAPWRDYWTKLPTLAASNTLPDIVSVQSLRLANFATLFEPLDDYVKQGFDLGQFDKSILEGLSYDGHLYALPYDFGPWIVYYNRDLFAKYKVEPPKAGWTRDDFVATAKALTQDGHYGFAVTATDWLEFALSDGAKYLTEDGALNFGDPELQAAFQSYVDLVTKEKVAPVIAASGQMSGDIARGRFLSGNAGMYVTGPWEVLNIRKSSNFPVGMAPLPAGKAGSVTFTAGSGFGVNKTGPHKDLAWKAVQALTGPEVEEYLASQGRAFPARTAQQSQWYEVAAQGVAGARETIEYALKTAQPYRTTANWNTVSELLEQYAPLAFGGSQSGAEVLNTVQSLAAE